MRSGAIAIAMGASLCLASCGAGVEPRESATAHGAPSEETAASAATEGRASGADDEPTTTTAAPVPPLQRLQESMDVMGELTSARFEMVLTSAGDPASSIGPQSLRVRGEYAAGGDDQHVVYSEEASGVDIEETVTGGTVYEGSGDGCTSYDQSDDPGSGTSGMVPMPSQFNELLAAAQAATEAEPLAIRGTTTTHLHADVTVRDMIAAAPADRSQELQVQYEGASDAYLDTAQPFDVFVDRQGRWRRIQISTTGSPDPSYPEPASTVIVDYFGFGDDVAIEAPTNCDDAFQAVGTAIDEGPVDTTIVPSDTATGPGSGNADVCAALQTALDQFAQLPPDQRQQYLEDAQPILAMCPDVTVPG